MALFVFVLFAVPTFDRPLSGFGIANQLLTLNYPRVLALALLLPAAVRIRLRPTQPAETPWLPDLLVIGFVLTQLGLRFTVDTTTNTLRYAIYAVLDVGLPYYVASRTLRDIQAFRDVLMSFVCGVMVMAPLAVFESLKYWLPYSSLLAPLDAHWGLGHYLSRGSLPAGPSHHGAADCARVPHGGCPFLLYVPAPHWSHLEAMWWLGFIALVGCLVASFSRGPWLAAAAALFVYSLTQPKALSGVLKGSMAAALIFAAVMITPLGAHVIDYLPFVGTIEADNISYRQHLLDVSSTLIMQHPWFGSFDYIYALSDQDLVTGGMVDVVNTYIGVGLSNGLVGLACFAGAFISVALMDHSQYVATSGRI